MLSELIYFLSGEQNYTTHTDTNHNIKSSSYLLVIGGNNNKTIGVYLVDVGLFKKSGIANDLFRPEFLK